MKWVRSLGSRYLHLLEKSALVLYATMILVAVIVFGILRLFTSFSMLDLILLSLAITVIIASLSFSIPMTVILVRDWRKDRKNA